MRIDMHWLRRPLAAAVATALVSTGSLTALQLISVKDEIAIGRQAQTEIRQQVPELSDAQTRTYVTALGRGLARHAGGAEYPYSFTVANQAELNAFALPGGPIWINRGILQTAGSESQVAGVLAHEIAHVAQRHSAQQLTKATVAGGLLGLLGSVIGNERGAGAVATQAVAGFTANSFMMKFSRDDEREADREGVRIMRAAGFDPRGMVEFMQILRDQQGRSPGAVEQFLSTHPAPAGRVSELEQMVASTRSGGRRDSNEFQQIKVRLQRLPAAPPATRR
jgi:predicted Zn-dependent protease